jgi:ferric-dicitrate binding protein FerR (iron transport regulator)
MTSGADEHSDEDLRRLIRLARDTLADEVLHADESSLLRLRAEREAPRHVRRLRWPVVAALVAIGGLGGALGGARFARRAAPLTFGIVQGPSSRIQFSDGTAVELREGARADVRDVGAHGGTVALARGRAHAQIVTRPRTRWRITAGPYELESAGTDLDLDWSDTGRALQLWVRAGTVKVFGPMIGTGLGAGAGMVLAAGQHLATRADDDKILLDAWDPAGSRSQGGPPGH